MKATAIDLKQRYESMDTDEPINLSKSGELTELAESVLQEVLAGRGKSVEVLDLFSTVAKTISRAGPMISVG